MYPYIFCSKLICLEHFLLYPYSERRIYTKLIKKLTVLATTILAAASLAVSASAGGYTATGGSSIGNSASEIDTSKYPYYYAGWNELAWRVDLYVSNREDGRIDKHKDTVALNTALGNGIRYVSSVIFTNVDVSSRDVYLQVDQTDNQRYTTSAYSMSYNTYPPTKKYTLPTAVKLDPSITSATITASNKTTYIVQGTTNGLPSYLAGCNRQGLHDTAESAAFMSEVTKSLSKQMGDNGLAFLAKLKSCVSSTIWTKTISELTEDSTLEQKLEAVQQLMPDAVYKNNKPLVEWAVTITPMMGWIASQYRADAFWLYNTPEGTMAYVTPYGKSKDTMLLMDAYHSAIFDNISTGSLGSNSIWKFKAFEQAVVKANGYIPADTIDKYWDTGILRANYTGTANGVPFNILKDLGTCAYIDEPGPLLGLNDWLNQTSYDDETIARRGGIYFAIMEMEDNSIPVYYYITPTPNDPILPPSTATPPTFTPNPPAGTKVKKVIYPKDNSLVVPNNPPQDFPDPLPGNPPYTEITPTDGTYPIDPDNPPSHILVECVQTDIPIYYHVFTFTNTTGNDYKDVFEYLKDNPSVRESAAVENITAVGTTPILADGTKSTYTPQSSSSGTIVAALSTSGTNLGNTWGWLTQQGSTATYNPTLNYKLAPNSDNPAKSAFTGSVEYYGKSSPSVPKQATISIHVKLYALKTSKVTTRNPNTDRIKTFDVTQFIDQTISGVTGSQHLNQLRTYLDDNKNNYNTTHFSSYKNSSGSANDEKHLAVIFSQDQHPTATLMQVHANNYAGGSGSATCKVAAVPGHSTGPCPGHGCTASHWCGGASGQTFISFGCHYTSETSNVAYGFNPQKEQLTEDKSGAVNYTVTPYTANIDKRYNTVGLTFPQKYYSYKDVVKLAASNKYNEDSEYLLPTNTNANANKYSVFDVLFGMNKKTDEYWLKYFNDSSAIEYQSYTASNADIDADITDKNGAIAVDYMSGSHPIDGVQFIAHRDLLSGDEVATSLAVSGYMAKYASKSSTASYLQFMKDCGFAFKGVSGIGGNLSWENNNINYIGHENRTIWVANASKLSDLAATNTGSTKNSYNTHYTSGNKDKYKVRMGLGGTSDDAIDIYALLQQTGLSNIKDSSLNKTTKDGDVLRSTYYYATYGTGDKAPGYDTFATAKHSVSCGHTSNSCGGGHTVHSTVCGPGTVHVTSVSSNKYIVGKDKYLPNGYLEETVSFHTDGSQSKMYDKIEASRSTFLIPLAVEGTTAGAYDETGKTGISYNTDLLKLEGGVLKYKESAELDKKLQEAQKAFEKTTFEIKSAEYATVGSKTDRKNDLLAEYRYTVPTRAYTFNPSFYMQYDDDFVDVNKSVWMLSNQPREINFKNILSIRLLQPKDSEGNTKDGAAGGYPTVIDSAWSTDKEDVTIQSETKLPVLKAGNSYTTETAASSGTITAYVILQDPEFTGNPNDAQNNEQIIKEYTAEMNKILEEIGAVDVAKYTSRDNSVKDKLGFAMYTNLTNGSSTNSQFQVHNGNGELNEKEPMVITHSKLTFSRTTGTQADKQSKTANDLDNWNFYALKGNDVYAYMKTNDKNLVEGYEQSGTEISDTTANRKFLGKQVLAQSSSSGHISSTLAEINKRLTDIMANGQDKNRNIISFSDPYLNSTDGTDLRWYTEDYEGFIVAVYNIDFTLAGDNKDINNKKDSTAGIITDFSAAYRHESDWRTATNDNAADLVTPTYSNIVENTYVHNSNVDLDKTGALTLLTTGKKDEDAQEVLKNWSKALAGKKIDYEPKIYGAGLELANVPIHFGSTVEGTGMIGNDNSRLSFYYQPTYFNVRGSVYDTTH